MHTDFSKATRQDREGHHGVREQDGTQVGRQYWRVQEAPAKEDGVDRRCLRET